MLLYTVTRSSELLLRINELILFSTGNPSINKVGVDAPRQVYIKWKRISQKISFFPSFMFCLILKNLNNFEILFLLIFTNRVSTPSKPFNFDVDPILDPQWKKWIRIYTTSTIRTNITGMGTSKTFFHKLNFRLILVSE